MSVQATCLGFPRIGASRELKRALESYWSKRSSAEELLSVATELRRRHLSLMAERGFRQVPCGDFSLYDHVLDTAVLFGAVPERYQRLTDPLERLFAMARGHQDGELDLAALEMTKWFDTNYHYIVPELRLDQRLELSAERLLSELEEVRQLDLEPRPVLLGPVSFLLLSKLAPGCAAGASTLTLLPTLLPLYGELLGRLHQAGVSWVQLDEPCLVTDLTEDAHAAYQEAFTTLVALTERPRLMLTTYFGSLDENLTLATKSGLDGLHIDLAQAPEQLNPVLQALPANMHLSLGAVSGRNVWRADLDAAHALVRRAASAVGPARLTVASSCSLLHVPVDLTLEDRLDPELVSWLAFATQKLEELSALAASAGVATPDTEYFRAARNAIALRRASRRTHDTAVRRRAAGVTGDLLTRRSPFPARAEAQQQRHPLPLFPTTTIGSFPQTGDVRRARAAWKRGDLSDSQYDEFLKAETRACVERQEAIGLDVLVHGEFERNDMVEYFGEQLAGFAFTQNGWVQSYGSRCVKPPVLYGDVSRPKPMTVEWSRYAQSLTKRPMKGMLTGPVTILQWSFVRDDQPREETCRQIALALRDEVQDLEAAGISWIQVDEPAIREGLPLRRRASSAYLRYAVDAFRLATSGVRDDTQIHTHMCYSEFGDMLPSIAEMDADVLSIETSRSQLELLTDFARFEYPNAIGPGVYDIHSPRVPTEEEITLLLTKAIEVLPTAKLWVNPDCGLKTRGWPEVDAALRAMVSAAHVARQGAAGG